MQKIFRIIRWNTFFLFYISTTVTYAQISPSDSLQSKKIDSLSRLNAFLLQQLDSIKKKHSPPPPRLRPAFEYQFRTDITFSTGNVDRQLIVLASALSYTKGQIQLETNPRYAFGEQNGQVAERDFFSDFSLNLWHPRVVYGFGLGILETSNLRAIDMRLLGGLGIGFHILRQPNANFSITNAIIYESTDFKTKADIVTFRNSTRFKGRYALLHNRLRINHLVFIQPSVQDWENVRWSMVLSAEIPLSRFLTLRTAINNTYESIVAEGRRKNDFTWTMGFTFGNK